MQGSCPSCWFFNNALPARLVRSTESRSSLTLPSLRLASLLLRALRQTSLPLATRCTLLLTLDLTLFDRPLLLPKLTNIHPSRAASQHPEDHTQNPEIHHISTCVF
ncbi:hypothetical protein DPSP01_009242 [Paraphaeosphaeria sporulosa]